MQKLTAVPMIYPLPPTFENPLLFSFHAMLVGILHTKFHRLLCQLAPSEVLLIGASKEHRRKELLSAFLLLPVGSSHITAAFGSHRNISEYAQHQSRCLSLGSHILTTLPPPLYHVEDKARSPLCRQIRKHPFVVWSFYLYLLSNNLVL